MLHSFPIREAAPGPGTAIAGVAGHGRPNAEFNKRASILYILSGMPLLKAAYSFAEKVTPNRCRHGQRGGLHPAVRGHGRPRTPPGCNGGRSRVVGVPQEDFQLRYKDAKSDFASYAFLSDALTGLK